MSSEIHDLRDARAVHTGSFEPTVPWAATDDGPDVADPVVGSRPRRRRPVGLYLTVGWLVLVVLVAVFADLLPLQDPLRADPRDASSGPSGEHWFGTDTLGRDLLARTAFGGRVTMLVAFASVGLAGVFGSLLGFVSGYYRGRIESVIVSAMDALLAFPTLVFALALTAFLGAGQRNLIIAITVVATPVFGRLVRAQTLTFSEREFVTAARATGARNRRILFTEVAPNVAPSIVAFTLVLSALAIVVEGSLSFLGLGVPPPTATWGSMIAMGRGELKSAAHIVLIPSSAMFLTVLALNVLGDRLRSYFDLGGGHG
jgi:peptide/nickel transport system permease protein